MAVTLNLVASNVLPTLPEFPDSVRHGPTVGAVDKFCSVSNTKDGICTIKARTIRLTYDTIYESENSIVFDNTQV